MGVPALFRWLSKKYPKIIYPVQEEEGMVVKDASGDPLAIPVNIAQPNPNGIEFDNLYLDMNGIVHPCTHPEGKPAPPTEAAMMEAVFEYTERIVNMVRPRKLLVMAIDGVAPRAKMNQQRSRRFRAAQDAKEREEARLESVALWEAMGKTVSEEDSKPGWDTNAITPGTPFMDFLALSLRYWVASKLNSDPGWKDLQVIISDASVPGEGEHKIMDFIRRMRSVPGYNPNTKHVIYGLDADLIMLSLATHEPNFRVLREDVFAKDTSPTSCRNCGQEGHYSAQCTNPKAEVVKPAVPVKTPFIFLDVSILREYLEVELDVPNSPFPFNLEQAIDDWVLLIFFVGNDFLPHLPSLEIREGAIDTLLKIWKAELPRMGGYLTNHGHLVLNRVQVILEGLAHREDDIFRRRRETEERQEHNAKRRKIEKELASGPSAALGISSMTGTNPLHPSLPPKPDFAAKADSIGLGGPKTTEALKNAPTAAQALAGSNHDIVANRRAIRMANMSAAEMLKAEMSAAKPVSPSKSAPVRNPSSTPAPAPPTPDPPTQTSLNPSFDDFPGLGTATSDPTPPPAPPSDEVTIILPSDPEANGPVDTEPVDVSMASVDDPVESILAGAKRSYEEGPGAEETPALNEEEVPDDDDVPPEDTLEFKKNADGTVEQPDTVRLWEPGYKERYYRQKFGMELNDEEGRRKIAQCYVEGMAWVLHYYYHGTPSWQWFYPYHFAPFASDFLEVGKMDVSFTLGEPFKPFEQLMAVFPAASKKHLPLPFQPLMEHEDSPIIDFYPTTFQIDMNGKKMAWQGVALLPFIDESRLLTAMAAEYPNIPEEELARNRVGNQVVFAAQDHPVYPFYEQLYGKKKSREPVPIDYQKSNGLAGQVLPNPDCIPGSTYHSPLPGCKDLKNDTSLSVLYFFPAQRTPHRSVLLRGAKPPPRQLTTDDLYQARTGGRGRGGYDNRNTGRSAYDRSGSRGGPPHRGQASGYNGSYNRPPRGGYSGPREPARYDRSQNDYGNYGRPPPSNQNYGYGTPPVNYPSYNTGYHEGGRYSSAPPSYGSGGTSGRPPYQNREYGRTPPPNNSGYGGGRGYDNRSGRGHSGRGGGRPPGGRGGAPNYTGYGGYGSYGGYNNQPGYGQRGW